ncbi:MAG TPA: FG-GAP-like repeat-containing protein [Polyangiaceae bacterium]|nr:FG-GAP-like repeat-containing protein [Polyangiaceae bacterium]
MMRGARIFAALLALGVALPGCDGGGSKDGNTSWVCGTDADCDGGLCRGGQCTAAGDAGTDGGGSSARSDAGRRDAATEDAALGTDAGSRDATPLESSVKDASHTDAGTPKGTGDASTPLPSPDASALVCLPCREGLVGCDGRCIDPLTSADHCGATTGCGETAGSPGARCGTGSLCAGGSCTAICSRPVGGSETYPAGDGPWAVTAGDFNRDGKPDLATANLTSDDVTVLLGNGDGTFASATKAVSVDGAHSVDHADFDHDGITDLVAVGYYGNETVVVLGNGDGTFGTPVRVSVPSPVIVAAGDFDDDCLPDLVIVGSVSAEDARRVLYVARNAGHGTFESPVAVGIDAQAVATADLNADRHLDVVAPVYRQVDDAGTFQPGVTIALGNGDGTFQTHTLDLPVKAANRIAVGDLTEDGVPDVVVAGNAPETSIEVLVGAGDGTFTLPFQPIPCTPDQMPESLAVADMNGDGHADVAVGLTNGPSAAVFLGNGTGELAPPLERHSPQSGGSGGIAVADFDRDGRQDLVTTSSGLDVVGVIRGGRDWDFAPHVDYPNSGALWSVAAGDLNGDLAPDVVVADYDQKRVSVFLGSGDGTLGTPVPYGAGTLRIGVTLADVNADQKLDVISANAQAGTVSVFLGNGDGTLGTPVDYPAGSIPNGVVVTDVSGDRLPDLLVADSSSSLRVLLGTGNGTFGPQAAYGAGTGAGAQTIAAGDVTGDGKVDVVVPYWQTTPGTNGFVAVLAGDGNGAFSLAATLDEGLGHPSEVALVDANEDGTLDLVTTIDLYGTLFHAGAGGGDGATPFAPGKRLPIGGAGLSFADIDGDAHLDAVSGAGVGNASWGAYVARGDGTGHFQGTVAFEVGRDPLNVATADLNRDGLRDVITANRIGGLSVLLGRAVCP